MSIEEPKPEPSNLKKASDALARSREMLSKAILDVVTSVPTTQEPVASTPRERARAIQTAASLKAAAVSGTLSLPPGPLGFAVIVPDLVSVWRIQAKMVADIAGAYGQSAHLSQEHMIYCLFRHAAAQVVRDLAARIGKRVVIRRATLQALQSVAQQLGIKVSKRVIAKSAARWLPVVGTIGVAGYAYYDTAQVAATATELFEPPEA
jgi:rRNA maturation endonuclease Nob1